MAALFIYTLLCIQKLTLSSSRDSFLLHARLGMIGILFGRPRQSNTCCYTSYIQIVGMRRDALSVNNNNLVVTSQVSPKAGSGGGDTFLLPPQEKCKYDPPNRKLCRVQTNLIGRISHTQPF